MNSADLSEILQKHIKEVTGDSLKIRRSTSLTNSEASKIQIELQGPFKPSIFDIYSANEIMFRCVVTNGTLFISRKAVGSKQTGFRRAQYADIVKFTLADPQSIAKAVDAIMDHMEECLSILLKKVEPIQNALKRIKEYRKEH